jgi:hypothetical protein
MHHLAERCARTNAILADEIDAEFRNMQRTIDARDRILRQKDEAMGVLFERLAKAGVDCSDLIP